MSKQIRPLVAFKKQNPELYNFYLTVLDSWEGLSKKSQENEFYWNYAYYDLKPPDLDLNNPPPFFWKDLNNRNNKLTITELGRLLLTGWYYNIEGYTNEISQYVIKAYDKKVKEEEGFNDMEIYKVVKHIRENISYYYNSKKELKFFILDSLFKNQLQELLPPPDKLKEYNKTIDFLTEIRRNQKRKGIDFWINRAEELEGYSYYLQEAIEDLNLDVLTFEDWVKEFNKNGEQYSKEIEDLNKEYTEKLLNSNITKLLK